MRISLPATAYRGTIGAKEEKTIWEILFQQSNSWTMQTCLFWVAESLDKCVCPKRGTPKSSGWNCNFEVVDTIGMHTWSVYRQIVASSFDHVLRFRSFHKSERFRSRSHLAICLSIGLSTSILLLVGQIALVAESYVWKHESDMPLRHQQSAKMHLIQMSKVYCPKHQNPGKRPRAQAGLHNCEVEVAMQDVFDTFQNDVFSRASS